MEEGGVGNGETRGTSGSSGRERITEKLYPIGSVKSVKIFSNVDTIGLTVGETPPQNSPKSSVD